MTQADTQALYNRLADQLDFEVRSGAMASARITARILARVAERLGDYSLHTVPEWGQGR